MRGERILETEDGEIRILFTNQALAEAEQRMGKSVLAVARDLVNNQSGVIEVAHLLRTGIQSANNNGRVKSSVSLHQAYKIMDEVGFTVVMKAVLEAMTDVSDENEGKIARFRVNYRLPAGDQWAASINGFATWADDDYMETYFGITTSDAARSGLSRYSAESGFKDIGVALPVVYSPSNHWSFMGAVVYKRMIRDAADSPVVDDEGSESQLIAGVVAIYRF